MNEEYFANDMNAFIAYQEPEYLGEPLSIFERHVLYRMDTLSADQIAYFEMTQARFQNLDHQIEGVQEQMTELCYREKQFSLSIWELFKSELCFMILAQIYFFFPCTGFVLDCNVLKHFEFFLNYSACMFIGVCLFICALIMFDENKGPLLEDILFCFVLSKCR